MADPQVILGPGPGLDCAVVEVGETLLVLKSDPITFVSDAIGWYLVQINANDIATTGATPRWLLATFLLPETTTTERLVYSIARQVYEACTEMGIAVVGGHTEITHGLDRPIAVATLIGQVNRDRLVTPQGAGPGDLILLTKSAAIEATAILSREFPERLTESLLPAELAMARGFIKKPGISVVRDAQIAMGAGRVTAMHDPTEGGLASALWELAEACNHCLIIEAEQIPVHPIASRVCKEFAIDPLAAISSGALLLTATPDTADSILVAFAKEGLPCKVIGEVRKGAPVVWRKILGGAERLARPERDELARVFES